MNELIWSQKWTGAQQILHERIKSVNQNLKENKSNCKIVLFLVDAVDLQTLENLAKTYKHVFVVSEHEIANKWPNVSIYPLPRSFYGAYYFDQDPPQLDIDRKFSFFVNRIEPIRQSWFYMLYQRGWLDEGYVSFNLQSAPLTAIDQSLSEAIEHGKQEFDNNHFAWLNSFDSIYEAIRKIVPYKNFQEQQNLCSLIIKSKFSIILETYFDRTDCRVFSEKTWRNIQLPRPWLLFAATGCVTKLRNMGFNVFDDYVDHSYDRFDTKESSVARQEAMLAECERLWTLPITDSVLTDWDRIAQHNRTIMKDWSQTWHVECEEHINQVALLAKHAL